MTKLASFTLCTVVPMLVVLVAGCGSVPAPAAEPPGPAEQARIAKGFADDVAWLSRVWELYKKQAHPGQRRREHGREIKAHVARLAYRVTTLEGDRVITSATEQARWEATVRRPLNELLSDVRSKIGAVLLNDVQFAQLVIDLQHDVLEGRNTAAIQRWEGVRQCTGVSKEDRRFRFRIEAMGLYQRAKTNRLQRRATPARPR